MNNPYNNAAFLKSPFVKVIFSLFLLVFFILLTLIKTVEGSRKHGVNNNEEKRGKIRCCI